MAWSAVLLALTSLPYALGVVLSTPEERFGGFVIGVEDSNSYLAKMRQGARGEWLFHLPYTSEEHTGALVYPFYLLLGKLARLMGLSFLTTYHLARWSCGLALLMAAYAFASHFTPWVAVRRTSLLLVAFSGGLGWFLLAWRRMDWLGSPPVDFILPEGFAFLAVYAFPHVALAQALLLVGLVAALKGLGGKGASWALLGGAVFLLSGLIVPFYVAIAYAVLGAYLLALWVRRGAPPVREARLGLMAALLPGFSLTYHLWVFSHNFAFRTWAAQNRVLSPHPLHYVLGYAPLGIPALGGLRWALTRRSEKGLFLASWVLTIPLLLYLPFNLQRRLAGGFQVALAVLASQGLIRYVLPSAVRTPWIRRLRRFPRYSVRGLWRFLLVTFVLMTTLTPLLLLAATSMEVARRPPLLFHSQAEFQAWGWLEENTSPHEVVLASYHTGNLIPAWAGNRVFLGHGSETLHSAYKRELVARFFQAETGDAFRQQLLCRYGIAYLYYGPHERILGDFDPGDSPYLEEVYRNREVTIYRVRGCATS